MPPKETKYKKKKKLNTKLCLINSVKSCLNRMWYKEHLESSLPKSKNRNINKTERAHCYYQALANSVEE